MNTTRQNKSISARKTIQENVFLLKAHLHDDVMRALHSGSCSQRKTKWRLIVEAGSLAVFQGVLATVKQTWISRSMVSQKKRICTKYRGKISPRALDSGYVACISKGAKNPSCTMFLLILLWQSPIQDRHPNHGERSFYTGLQHLVKRHRLHSVQQLQGQQRRTAKRPALKRIIGTCSAHLQIWFEMV